MQRLLNLLSSKQVEEAPKEGSTKMHLAVMKAVCNSQQWIKEVDIIANQTSNELKPNMLGAHSECRNYDCRILVI